MLDKRQLLTRSGILPGKWYNMICTFLLRWGTFLMHFVERFVQLFRTDILLDSLNVSWVRDWVGGGGDF